MVKNEKICVVGLGYIGLPTAALVADAGFQVIGVDISADAVNTINSGKVHIEEPGLERVVSRVVASKNLVASTEYVKADVFLIAVPTPIVENATGADPEPDISYIEAVCKSIAPVLEPGNLVLLESTSPIGTTQKVFELIAQLRPDFDLEGTEIPAVSFAYCPERVIPGNVLHELVHNDRVVGGKTPHCSQKAVAFYESFVKGECTRATSPETAELVKLAENSFRDLNIAFANQLSLLCDNLGIDVWEAIGFANRHPRVNILQPGPGVGGHCIAVDPWFLVSSDKSVTELTRVARRTNDDKPNWVIQKVEALAAKHPERNIICCGLTFKPDVDDFRESPALQIFESLQNTHGARVKAFDPYIDKLNTSVTTVSEADIAASQEILVLLVDHKELKALTPVSDTIVDTRGCWNLQQGAQ